VIFANKAKSQQKHEKAKIEERENIKSVLKISRRPCIRDDVINRSA